ncbi:uncharacterized protein LOC132713682 [Ruditapes philippinarum]|uniref:uncharacterized protein LOC132713682 n=1 Tax=Ruditapes philippinarum TaxID=129788 RepID=UPI00295B1F16|nr:uncharacterized protein LOC132713682 [Ruditapes philippinarum]
MKNMWMGIICAVCIGVAIGMTTKPAGSMLPSGAVLDRLVNESFKNVDSDQDGLIEPYEFDTLIIVADKDDDGCMTLAEYKNFSAGTPAIATMIYKHFDTDNTDCLQVNDVYDQFNLMDSDHSNTVTLREFESYYVKLLHTLFNTATVG